MNILIVNGHEYWEKSPGRLNKALTVFAQEFYLKNGHEVTTVATDKEFEVEKEVVKFLEADLILYISPVYWMGFPARFKHYTDRVYSGGRGKLYRHDGRVDGGDYGSAGLLNSSYSLITTWNAPVDAFENKEAFLFEGKSVDDVFLNFHSAQKFLGIKRRASFSFHDVIKDFDYSAAIKDFEAHLLNLIN